MGLEIVLLTLAIRLVYLVSVYITRFGKKESDPFIIASFVLLAIAVSERCVINIINYWYAFDYSKYVSLMGTAPLIMSFD